MQLLKIPNPKHKEAKLNGRSVWGIPQFIHNFSILPDGSIKVPRGVRLQLLDMLAGHDYELIDRRHRSSYIPIDALEIKYRPYQVPAVSEMYGKDEGLLVAPAGSGKTVICLSMIPMHGQKCLWLTHTKALAYQTLGSIEKFLPSLSEDDVGIIGDKKWKIGNYITIGLIPTLVRREAELVEMSNDFGIVILDEAHHCPASTFTKVITFLNPYFLYGATATPFRRDKLETLMFQTIGPEIFSITADAVESQGGIIMPKVIYRAFRSRLEHRNDIQRILREHVVENNKRNGMIVGDVLAEAVSGNYCIVVTDRRKHAEKLYDLISLGWDKTGIATGMYSRKYVEEQSAKLNKKEITVLVCTFSLLGEGFDVPFLNRAFIAMPFRAEGKVVQLIGRVQRAHPDKDDAKVYDYVDVDVGVLQNQFFTKGKKDCRYNVYRRLNLEVEPYG